MLDLLVTLQAIRDALRELDGAYVLKEEWDYSTTKQVQVRIDLGRQLALLDTVIGKLEQA